MNQGSCMMHAIIRGRVQGVGFRATTRFYALKHEMTGTVRNLPDGTVEIYAVGNRDSAETLLEDLRRDRGLSRIDSVATDYADCDRDFDGFRILF